jgi:hypothetical protein
MPMPDSVNEASFCLWLAVVEIGGVVKVSSIVDSTFRDLISDCEIWIVLHEGGCVPGMWRIPYSVIPWFLAVPYSGFRILGKIRNKYGIMVNGLSGKIMRLSQGSQNIPHCGKIPTFWLIFPHFPTFNFF